MLAIYNAINLFNKLQEKFDYMLRKSILVITRCLTAGQHDVDLSADLSVDSSAEVIIFITNQPRNRGIETISLANNLIVFLRTTCMTIALSLLYSELEFISLKSEYFPF